MRSAVQAIEAVRGDLPPLLDDYNVDDDDLDYDEEIVKSWSEKTITEGYAMKMLSAIQALRVLTPTERISVIACVDEFWKPP